jgi:hypothetical protein
MCTDPFLYSASRNYSCTLAEGFSIGQLDLVRTRDLWPMAAGGRKFIMF